MSIKKEVLNTVHGAAIFKRRVRVLARHISNELAVGGSVLDVGCGDGSIAAAVMKQNSLVSFNGIDVFLRPQVAIPASVYNGENIPFEDNSFDYVTIIDVLHHTDDPEVVLRECLRVARKGVVIKDHLREGLAAHSTLRFMDWVGNKGHNVRLPYNYLSNLEWHDIFERLNAKPVTWKKNIGLYAFPANFLFDRELHFISHLQLK